MEIQLAALKATVEAGFASSNRRIDDLRFEQAARMERVERVQGERHAENREHLERIEEKQDMTNGKVIRAEEQIRTLFARTKSVMTLPSARLFVAIVIGTATGTAAVILWVLHLVGKI